MELPRSRARTAYELLSEICKLIIAEPLRYDQGSYIIRPDDVRYRTRQFPACNTIGCVAGWVCTLRLKDRFSYVDIVDLATGILGLNPSQTKELFAAAPDIFWNGFCDMIPAQTKEHAEAGVKHIKAFQKKYEEQLKTKRLK